MEANEQTRMPELTPLISHNILIAVSIELIHQFYFILFVSKGFKYRHSRTSVLLDQLIQIKLRTTATSISGYRLSSFADRL